MEHPPSARRSSSLTRLWPLMLVTASAPLAVERIRLLARHTPTGADETLYLMQALDWLGHLEKVSNDPARTRGVPALIFPVAALTDATWAYRLLFCALSIGLCGVVYLIGRRFLGRIAAAWSALLLGLSSVTLLSSVALLPDLPAALAVATAFAVYWRRVVRAPPDTELRGLWPIGLAIAAAFYFNISFAALAGITLAVDFLIFRRRDLFARPTIRAAAVLGALLAPYFIVVWIDHGAPYYTLARALRGSAKLGGPLPGGDPGYVTYARWFFDPAHFFDRFWGIAVLIGVGTLAYALARGRPIPRRDASLLALWLTLPTLAMAFLFHAEARYVLPWLPAFFLALGLPVEAVMQRFAEPEKRRRIAVGAVVPALIAGVVAFGIAQYRPAARRLDGQTAGLKAVHAAASMLGEPARPPCQVFARQPREFELHTGCKTFYYRGFTRGRLIAESDLRPDATFYVWWEALDGDEVAQPAFLREYLVQRATLEFTVVGPARLGRGFVYRYAPSA